MGYELRHRLGSQ